MAKEKTELVKVENTAVSLADFGEFAGAGLETLTYLISNSNKLAHLKLKKVVKKELKVQKKVTLLQQA